MPALKSYLPTLAKSLGRSRPQLDQWLREMVAAKLLKPKQGRGPGSGVELNAHTLSIFLLALLGSDIRKDAIAAARGLSKAIFIRGKDPANGVPLIDAIVTGLTSRGQVNGVPAKLHQIVVYRGQAVAVLYWFVGNEMEPVSYSSKTNPSFPTELLSVTASLHDKAIERIASDICNLDIELTKVRSNR